METLEKDVKHVQSHIIDIDIDIVPSHITDIIDIVHRSYFTPFSSVSIVDFEHIAVRGTVVYFSF